MNENHDKEKMTYIVFGSVWVLFMRMES